MVNAAANHADKAKHSPIATLENLTAVHAHLRKTFDSQRTKSVEWRRTQLKAMERMLVENETSMVQAVMVDHGKALINEPTLTEYCVCLAAVQETLSLLDTWMKPKKVKSPVFISPATSCILPTPKGVVAIMSPWNYPIQLALVPLIGAIAAGNCALLKAAERSSQSSKWLCEMIPKYLDTDAIVVEGVGTRVFIGAMLELKWDHIFFTGSSSVGNVVYQAAAKHMTTVTLELGGKNPVIVDEDISNMYVTARRIAWGKWFNCGQTCIGCDYILVHKNSYQSLVDNLKIVRKEFYGENPKASVDFSRIINQERTKFLANMLKDCTIIAGGESDIAECYIAPTIITDVKEDSPALKEEIFGPILPIVIVDSIDDALQFVNKRDHPLALYVFSSNNKTVEHVIANSQSGAVNVNEVMYQFLNRHLPFGGIGPSGIGAYHGKRTFKEFTHYRSSVSSNLIAALDLPVRYPPYVSAPPSWANFDWVKNWKLMVARYLMTRSW